MHTFNDIILSIKASCIRQWLNKNIKADLLQQYWYQ